MYGKRGLPLKKILSAGFEGVYIEIMSGSVHFEDR